MEPAEAVEIGVKKLRGAGVKFLKDLRDHARISGYEAAKRLKLAHNSYYYYEKTAVGLPLNILVRIRRAFDLTWAELGQLIEAEFSVETKKKKIKKV